MGRSGKATSKKWNVQDLKTGELGWRDMLQYEDFRKIPEEAEVYLGNFEGQLVLERKITKTESWKKNGVYEKVKEVG